jgi:hypothetical protein
MPVLELVSLVGGVLFGEFGEVAGKGLTVFLA